MHDISFLIGQFVFLFQNGIRYAYHSKIMKQRGIIDFIAFLFALSVAPCNFLCKVRNPYGMADLVFISFFHRGNKRGRGLVKKTPHALMLFFEICDFNFVRAYHFVVYVKINKDIKCYGNQRHCHINE